MRTTRFLAFVVASLSLLAGGVQIAHAKQATVTTITSSANPSNPGDPVTITATVTSQQGGQSNQHCPDGIVQFQINGANIGNAVSVAPLNLCNIMGSGQSASASVSISVTFPNAGSFPIVAIYGSDHDFESSTSGVYTQVVGEPSPIATSTAITSSGNPSTVGDAVTFTAVVTPAEWGFGVPSGTVTFESGGTTLFIGTLTSSGWVAFTTSSLPQGADVIKATYGGDSVFSGSNASRTQNVNARSKPATTLALAASPTTSILGEKVWLTATVQPAEFVAGAPTGNVTFTSGNVSVTGALTDGWVTVTTSALPLGADTITATYGGDANYGGSSATTTELVKSLNSIGTSVALVASPAASMAGDPVWITATVTPQNWDFGDPTGTVTVTLTDAQGNKSTIFSGALPPSGWLEFTTISLPLGLNSLTATYSGDANYSPSVSAVAKEQVGPVAGKIATSVAVVASPSTSAAGEPVWLTATVTPSQWFFGNPTGTVTFTSGNVTITGTLTSGQSADWVTVMTTALPQGTNTITATYNGDANYASSSATTVETVHSLGIETTLSLIASPNPSSFGDPVTITVTVIPGLWGYGVPTGPVTVTSGAMSFTGTLADGWFDFLTSALPQGTNTITATYGGNSTFKGSTATVTQTVGAPPASAR